MNIVPFRMLSYIVVLSSWRRGCAQVTTEVRQDKKPHIAAWTVGCFVSAFSVFLYIAAHRRDVCVFHFANDSRKYRTSRAQS